jgi:hypothetical protein
MISGASAQNPKRALRLTARVSGRVSQVTTSRSRHWQTPLSVQTTPHGQPLPPGAQLGYPEQFMQLPFEHVQLWPPLDTFVLTEYVRQLPCE